MSERDDEMIEAVARELRRPVRLGDAVVGEVMRRVRGAEGSEQRAASRRGTTVQRAWHWVASPRTIRVSPLTGTAALAAALLLAVGLARRTAPETTVVAATPAPQSVPSSLAADRSPLTQFILVAPAAREVSLVGDFNDWQVGSAPLRATASGGVWTIEVPLAPGRHRYAFVVDGSRWLPDPAAPPATGDDFGTPSSVVTVTEQGV